MPFCQVQISVCAETKLLHRCHDRDKNVILEPQHKIILNAQSCHGFGHRHCKINGDQSAIILAMTFTDPNIIAVYFHGSRANGYAAANSDSDIAVVTKHKPDHYSDLVDAVESQLDLPNLDIRVVDLESSPVFLFSFIKSGKLLYQKSQDERVSFESMAMRKYYDTEHMRSIFRSYLYKSYAN